MSITAQELRIGNWVKRKSSGNFQQVREIYTNYVLMDPDPPLRSLKSMSISLRAIEPIPLTPDILLACGFERRGTRFFDKEENLPSYLYCSPNIDNPLYYENCVPEIQYLHQLQNLYFLSLEKK